MARTLDDTDLLQIVDALAPGEWVSGAHLAEAAGISREALSKRVRKLISEWQIDVEASPGLGYRLVRPLQRLTTDGVRAGLPSYWREGLRLAAVPRTGSTNSDLLERPAKHDPQVLLAEMQTAGRGRRGRAWASPFGANLYLSLAWTFDAWPPRLTTLPLAVGVCCARALRECDLNSIALKWPNDLRVGAAKLGGILVEQRGEVDGPCRVIIGVGLNVSMSAKQASAVSQAWTALEPALEAVGRQPPRRDVLAARFLVALADGCEAFAADGFTPFAAEWAALDMTRERPVTVLAADGNWTGIAHGVNADGALRVQTPTGLRLVHAGDVSLRVG